ncbi:MAG: hypothetical protein IKF24_05680 [Eubacterium sp.]|nr:hypothetical protein [Eubacterium sp.]
MESSKTKNIIVTSIIVIFIAIVVVGILTRCSGPSKKDSSDSSSAVKDNVPMMSATYGNTKVGNIYGYTNELQENVERNTIVIIKPDRTTTFKINENGDTVRSIKYEIKSTDDNRLVDHGKIKEMRGAGKGASFDFKANAIMEVGKEYRIKFIVTSDKHDAIYYYARAIIANHEFVDKQLKFAKRFSDRTFEETERSDLMNYLETDPKVQSNDNLGQVTINSSYTMLLWSTLAAEKTTKTKVTIKECTLKNTGPATTFTLTYQVKAKNAEKVTEKYNVWETITVFSYAGKEYVTGYDREVNQIWKTSKNNLGASFIDLGIQNYDMIEHVESANKKYIAFAINGDVYAQNVENRNFYQIYKFNARSSEELEMTKAKVVDIDNKGNVDYMIYGYSPAENHKGRNGISIMSYNIKNNVSKEQVFIPCKSTAGLIDNQLKTLCHVGDKTLYIMLDDTIYYANLKTQEWGKIVEHLDHNSYAVSDDGKYLAYNKSASHDNSRSIIILDLNSGEKRSLDAGDGEKISVLGFSGQSMIYGTAKDSDEGKTKFFPISKLTIVDYGLREQKAYSKKNVFIKGIEIKDGIINIKRWKKGKNIDDDQLLDNTEEAAQVCTFSYYTDDIKMREEVLSFTNKLPIDRETKILPLGKAEFSDASEIDANLEKRKGEVFYVYGYGKLQSVEANKKDAIEKAKGVYGLVLDKYGKKIWTKEEHYKD